MHFSLDLPCSFVPTSNEPITGQNHPLVERDWTKSRELSSIGIPRRLLIFNPIVDIVFDTSSMHTLIVIIMNYVRPGCLFSQSTERQILVDYWRRASDLTSCTPTLRKKNSQKQHVFTFNVAFGCSLFVHQQNMYSDLFLTLVFASLLCRGEHETI